MLNTFPVLPLESGVDEAYADIRLQLEQAGNPIGPNDLLIAAHALTLKLTLVTDNTDKFSRVPRLRAESWAV